MHVLKYISIFVFCVTLFNCSSNDELDETYTQNETEISNEEETNSDEVENGGLDPLKTPAENFDLSQWKLSVPIDEGDGTATDISVAKLNANYDNTSYFYTATDGGMVFKCTIDGVKTSVNTSYTRTEFREMLRGTNTNISTKGVNKNNWVFGTAPESDLITAGGYDGTMTATLAVNHVTTTGDNGQVGRVVIGQIHANDDEPIRIYYRKLPNNENGSIYFAHEPRDGYGNEVYITIIGSKSNSASNPDDGIPLDEKFSYTINVTGDILTVTLSREGKEDIVKTKDMTSSGYNVGGQYMYFKAGVYVQNNTGDLTDYDQATFYQLETSHTSL